MDEKTTPTKSAAEARRDTLRAWEKIADTEAVALQRSYRDAEELLAAARERHEASMRKLRAEHEAEDAKHEATLSALHKATRNNEVRLSEIHHAQRYDDVPMPAPPTHSSNSNSHSRSSAPLDAAAIYAKRSTVDAIRGIR
jgi:uncharacterized membrane protein YccC